MASGRRKPGGVIKRDPTTGQAAFDPTHPASTNCRFSAVAIDGSFRDLVTGQVGVNVGTTIPGYKGLIGGTVRSDSGSAATRFAGRSTVADEVATIATICQFEVVNNTFQVLFWNTSSGGSGTTFYLHDGSREFRIEWGGSGGVAQFSGSAPTAGVPYFLAVTAHRPSQVAHLVMKRLDTGQTTFFTASLGSIFGYPGNGTYEVGCNTYYGQPSYCNIATIMYSAEFLSRSELAFWAKEPWSFWYPSEFIDQKVAGGAPAGVDAQLSATEAADIAAISGTISGAGITGNIAATEAPDTASLRALTGASARVNATEPPDTASINVTRVLQTVNMVVIGDSVLATHDGTSFPDELVANLSGDADITLTSFASPGQTLEDQLDLYASQAGAAYDAGFDRNICILHHGSNDLLSENTLANWQTQAQTLVNYLTATGYEVITTEAYQWDFDAFTGYIFNTASDWNAYNTTVNSRSGITTFINTSDIPELTNQANVSNPPYYLDQEHLTATGTILWADFATPIVRAVINDRTFPPSPIFVPGHSLLTNMLACYLPGVYAGVPVQSIGPTLSNGAGGAGTVTATLEGPASRSNTLGAAKGLIATAPSAFKTWTNFTAYWRGVIIGSGDAFCPLLGVSWSNTDTTPYFMINVATDASGYAHLQAFYGDNTVSEVTPFLSVTGQYGSIIDVAATVTVGGSVTFYVNGASVGTNTMSVISASDANAKIVINQGIDATSRSPNASVNMACFWDRALSSTEILGLHNTPYAFLQSGSGSPVTAQLAATEAADTASMRADVVSVSARLNATEAADVAAMRADVVSVSARLNATEAPDTAALNALTGASAVMIYTEPPDTTRMQATVEWNAQLNATEAPDVAVLNAYLDGTARLNATEAPDVADIEVVVTVAFIQAQLAATEAPDGASLRANTHTMAQLAATEAPDTAGMSATAAWNAPLGAVEAPDTASLAATVTSVSARLNATEPPDVAALRADVTSVSAQLAATEAPDIAALRATSILDAVLGAIEASDIAVMRANAAALAQLAATEAPDVAALRANLTLPAVTARVNAVEPPDGAQIRVEVPIYSPNEQPGAPGVLTFGRRVTISRW